MRRHTRLALSALASCSCLTACGSSDSGEHSSSATGVGRKQPTTVGFLLADFDQLMYHTKDGKAECPDGLLLGNRENWEAQFPTPSLRQRHLERCGSLANRGPNCENVWFNPRVMKDPLPWREVKGTVSYGVNLDGTPDGRATEHTCQHQKFVSPEGESGIDNQFYRFAGCSKTLGVALSDGDRKLRIEVVSSTRILLEITGVTDERNDANVGVAIYRGRDQVSVDATDKVAPWQSQRIEEGALGVIARMRGRIVEGVLTTDPVDVDWGENLDPMFRTSQLIRGMTLRLKLTPTGAEGMRTGYLDLHQLWENYAQTGASVATYGIGSGPAAYEALYRLADGYKNPQTGACTALSTAEKLVFVRARVIHPIAVAEAKP